MITTAKVAFICEKLTNFAQNFYTMVKIGKYNRLRVVKNVDFGAYLDGGDGVEILLPARYIEIMKGDLSRLLSILMPRWVSLLSCESMT